MQEEFLENLRVQRMGILNILICIHNLKMRIYDINKNGAEND